jgi:spore germination protein YaaH
VNIDLERVPPADRRALTSFATDLGAALWERRKTLTIAVPGKTGDDLTDPSSGAFDLAALAAITDLLIIMAYDEHWDTGKPGPVASLPWVEAVVRYTLTQVRPEKVLLGVPFYGYEWPGRGPGVGISMREAVRRSQQAGVPILWDERAKVPYFRVGDRIVYFEDARSLAFKLSVGERARLAGIAAWRLGHELPDVWEAISRAVPLRPAPTVVPVPTPMPVPIEPNGSV